MSEPTGDPGRFSPISSDDLLHHAGTVALHYPSLVYTGGGPSDEEIGRVLAGIPFPSSTDFRRAVSAAYYALFHAVTLRAAALLVPGSGLVERYRRVRIFEHKDVRLVALWVSGAGTPSPSAATAIERVRRDQQVRSLADAVRRLSDERRDADYDHFGRFTQSDAFRAINRATEAVNIVESRRFATSEGGRSFLGLIADQARARL